MQAMRLPHLTVFCMDAGHGEQVTTRVGRCVPAHLVRRGYTRFFSPYLSHTAPSWGRATWTRPWPCPWPLLGPTEGSDTTRCSPCRGTVLLLNGPALVAKVGPALVAKGGPVLAGKDGAGLITRRSILTMLDVLGPVAVGVVGLLLVSLPQGGAGPEPAVPEEASGPVASEEIMSQESDPELLPLPDIQAPPAPAGPSGPRDWASACARAWACAGASG